MRGRLHLRGVSSSRLSGKRNSWPSTGGLVKIDFILFWSLQPLQVPAETRGVADELLGRHLEGHDNPGSSYAVMPR